MVARWPCKDRNRLPHRPIPDRSPLLAETTLYQQIDIRIPVSILAYLGPVTSTYTACNTERYLFGILPFGVTATRAAVGRLQSPITVEKLDNGLCVHRSPHYVGYTCEIIIFPCPSGTYTFDNVCRWTLAPLLSSHDPETPPQLNLTVEPRCSLNVSLSHALPTMTRRISIWGDMHYDMSHLAYLALTGGTEQPRTIIRKYTETNATDVELPTPNDTKKAMPESVYGSTDSTTSVTMAKYEDAYSLPRCSRTFLPCRTIR